MANKAVYLAAICCSVLGCGLLIGAMASVSWLIGCVHSDNMIKAMKEYPPLQKFVSTGTEQLFKGMDVCYYMGLFKFTMKEGDLFSISYGMDFGGIQKLVIFGVIAMVATIVCSVVGIFYLLVAVGGSWETYENKSAASTRTTKAMILLFLAGLFGIVAMASCTTGTEKALHSPVQYMAFLGEGGASSFQKILSRMSVARRKRDLSLEKLKPDLKQYMETLLVDMDPHYGYPFALGWIAIIPLVAATVLTAMAKKRLVSQPHNASHDIKI